MVRVFGRGSWVLSMCHWYSKLFLAVMFAWWSPFSGNRYTSTKHIQGQSWGLFVKFEPWPVLCCWSLCLIHAVSPTYAKLRWVLLTNMYTKPMLSQVTVVFESIIAWDHRIAWDRRIDKRHNLNSTLAFSHTHTCHNESMIMNLNTLCITQFTKQIPDGRSCSIL